MCTLGGCLYLCCCGTALFRLDFEICYIKQTKKDINTNYDWNKYWWVCPVGVRSLLDNLKQTIEKKRIVPYWIHRVSFSAFVFRALAFSRVQMWKKKPVISNTGNFFCFNSNVSNLYHNFDIYEILKSRKNNVVCERVYITLLLRHWSNSWACL